MLIKNLRIDYRNCQNYEFEKKYDCIEFSKIMAIYYTKRY